MTILQRETACGGVTLVLWLFILIASSQSARTVCDVATGREPNPEDETCGTYYACSDFVARLRRCRIGQQFDYDEGRCRRDKDVWCTDQRENFFPSKNNFSALTTQPLLNTTANRNPTSTLVPADTTDETTALNDQNDAHDRRGRGNGSRLGRILRMLFPQFFTDQGAVGAAGITARNAAGSAQVNQALAPTPNQRGFVPRAQAADARTVA
ncbi:hypothetical protein PoB_006914400 [Plakobranchus ocellatus]|uniref:Chitin-binding type-2 domain-containing protein n=1 Tax=Plakobranchus ocellatus TaxID=259542 RepID=A0AAV4DEL4_9GAST|nr:hypothetical protein PoB_006914400 [Plakobranchus ocellatus]